MIKTLLIPMVLTACLLSPGCNRVSRTSSAKHTLIRQAGARLSIADAVRIAQHTAKKQGCDLSQYEQHEAEFANSKGGGTWFVFFEGKRKMPGNHFSVTINDKTGSASFQGGE
jgi:hypothetical protein